VGNNFEIIRICEERGCVFNDRIALTIAIRHHRYPVFRWMMETYGETIGMSSHQMLKLCVAASSFEIFGWILLNTKDFERVASGMTEVLLEAHRVKSFTAVFYLSSIVELAKKCKKQLDEHELFAI
jgi:hypothetical protein